MARRIRAAEPVLRAGLASPFLAVVGLLGCLAPIPARCADGFRGVEGRKPDLPGPVGLAERVSDGTLRLRVEDAVHLALQNGTDPQIARLSYDDAVHQARGARQAFDLQLSLSGNTTQASEPTTSTLAGAGTLVTGTDDARFSLSQTLPTATRFEATLAANRSDSNNRFATFNPSYGSNLTLRLTQTLLGRQAPFPTRARVLRADVSVRQSRADLMDRLGEAVVRVVSAYWAAVQARENFAVARHSLELAEATYGRDKRSLELGALPPLDIFRSEAAVAGRRLRVIEAQHASKRAEDDLRRLMGVDLDPEYAALPLDLVDPSAPQGELFRFDVAEAVERALDERADLMALRCQLANAETAVRLARHSLKPDVSLTGTFLTRGRGGVQLDPQTTPPSVTSEAGLGDAFGQIKGLDYRTWGLSVQVGLPFPNRGAKAELGSAEVARQRTQYQLRDREKAVALEVQRAWDDIEKAKASLEVATLSRDLARKTLEAEQRKRDLGETTPYFVLQTQADLADAESNLTQAGIEYQRAVTAAARAAGSLLALYHVEVPPARK